MIDIRKLIVDFQRRGIVLLVEDGRLKSRAAPGALDAAAAALIRAHKDDIVAFLERRTGGAEPQPAARGDVAPLSATQRRLWLVDRIEGSTQYILTLAMRLDGDVAPHAVQAALDALVRRHEVLRTVIVEGEDGTVVQRVAPARPVALAVHALDALTPAEREAALARLRRERVQAPFELARDLMLRADLARLSADSALAMLAVHHIAIDGASAQLMLDEFAHFYNAACDAAPASQALAPLPLQYADFALWQAQRLAQPAARASLAYWRARLDDLAPVHGIPTDFPRPAVKGQAAQRVRQRLDPAQCHALRALGQRHGATLFMVLHSALALVFARFSHRADIVMGTPVSGRGHGQLAGLIGFFANTVMLRTEVAPDTNFDQLLQGGRAAVLAAFEHQEVPFDSVIEALRPERSASYTPGFQLMFSYQGAAPRAPALHGLRVALLAQEEVRTPFDLSVIAGEDGEALTLHWDFDPSLFLAASVERMSAAFGRVLALALSDSAAPIGSAALSGDGDLALMAAWNDTVMPYPSRECLHQLIERQSALAPRRDALWCGQTRLSYAALNGKANALACRLRELGVLPGQVVAVIMPPCVEVPLSFLAIMKAGAAFAPLDINWPPARLQGALEAMGHPLVLAGPHGLGGETAALVAHTRVRAEALALAPDLGIAMDSEAAIYVMHTSGSTGLPKGALNRHRGVVNRLAFMSRRFGGGEDEVVLQTTHHCFDSAVWQFFWPLIKGGATVLPAMDDGLRADLLAALIARQRVTLSDFTPALLRLFAEEVARDGTAPGQWRLRHLIVGGEETTPSLARLCRAALPGVELHNFYGASEASIGSVCYTLPRAPAASVPIGRPIDNVVVAVVGPDLQSLPVGAPGEILMGGDCVGMGYLGRDEETRRAFVTLARPLFGCDRYYRTGDLGRWRDDGMLEFLGRIDSQVKIRGFRIELGEIQSALEALPAVRQAALATDGEGAARRIVAYVAPRRWPIADQARWEADLRAALALTLPDFMLPSALVALQAIPLAASGKIDRRALPPAGADQGRAVYQAPLGEEETALAAIWCELLVQDRVGRQDDFFALGGHSLLATQLAARVRRQLHIDMPLRVLFAHPRLDTLAAWCRAARGVTEGVQ